ncbi:hypothetical protein ACS0TY_001736 [Phlomoides rotata]
MKSKPLDLWCVCGDFNSILHPKERKDANLLGIKITGSAAADNCQPEFWGPIPFKLVNWLLDREDFRMLVLKFWQGTEMEGWGGYVLKGKLKLLKREIK